MKKGISKGLTLISNIRKARAKGVSYKEYIAVNKAKKQRAEARREEYISLVCEKSGWTRQKAIEKMEAANEMGISYYNYARNECWKKDEAGLNKLVKWLKKERIRKQENIDEYLRKISEDTGWSVNEAKMKVQEAQANCGCGYEDYYLFKLYEQDKEKQKEFLTLDIFSKLKLMYNDFGNQDVFNNKVEFNYLFNDVIKRKWFYNKDISYDKFVELTSELEYLFAKPLRGTQGKGISKIELSGDKKEIYDMLVKQKDMIVEEYIKQHDKMSVLCPTSVNTVRVITVNKGGKCHILCAGLRMGHDKVVDNFHAGGMIAGIDINTGEILTNAVNYNREVFEKHPVTGQVIRGFQIPNWDSLCETCDKISSRVEELGLVGWDFAVVDDGVELIEGNPGPSYVMMQLPFAMDGVGIRYLVENHIDQ